MQLGGKHVFIMALASTLAALSLNTHHLTPQLAGPAPRQSPAPNKSCTRTRLRSFKQAAKAKFRRGGYEDMTTRPVRSEVIEISDDDSDNDDLSHQRPQAPTSYSLPSQAGLKAGDNEAELDSSPESNFSDVASPTPANRQTLLENSVRDNQEVRERIAISRTTSNASSYIPEAPRRQRNSRVVRSETSSVSADENPRGSEVQPRVPQLNGASSSTGALSRSIPSHPKPFSETGQCPYYYDIKLEVKMYSGEGYERFPVVLGTVEGHKDICDKWNAQMASKTATQDRLAFDTGIPPPTRSVAELELEDACQQAVLHIFPEIEHEFVRNLYRQGYMGVVGEDVVGTITAALIADIAESETYPKQKLLKRKASSAARDENGVNIGWNREIRNHRDYCRETVILLATVFDHIPTHYVAKIVQEILSLFDAFGILSGNENKFYNPTAHEKPYKRLRQPRRALEAKYQRKSYEQRDGHLYVNLVNELQAARQSEAREASRIKRQKASDVLESENSVLHIAQGSMVECQCCFDEKPINRAVACEGEHAHFFCNDCVRRQAESQVGAMKYEMLCMDTSGCQADLSAEAVAQAIPLQLYDKLAFNQQQTEISLAGLQGLEMCPFCDFKAICDPVEVDTVFDCQNPDCGLVTCRKCKERSHLPRTCEEIKNDKGLGARHTVEEARSKAMMRTCPKCKVKLIKEFGCNKMVCTNCRTIMCYVCQKDISGTGKEQGYDHFHRAGAACALHDQTGVDRHEEEADAAETAAIAKAKAQYEDIDEKTLQIETGKTKKKQWSVNPIPGAAPPQPRFRGMLPHHAALPPPLFRAMPQLPAMPPNLHQALVQGQAQLQHDLNRMHQLMDQPNYVPPNFQQHIGQPGYALADVQQFFGQPNYDPPNMHQLIGQPGYGPPNVQQLIGQPGYRPPIAQEHMRQPGHGPPNVAGQAPPLDPGLQQRQALQLFLRQRRQHRA